MRLKRPYGEPLPLIYKGRLFSLTLKMTVPSSSSILDLAKKKAAEFDWLGAVDCYRKASDSLGEVDPEQSGRLCELTGYAFYRVAMQAEQPVEFREKMQEAITTFERAQQLYGSLGDKKRAFRYRCGAMIAWLAFWLTPDPSEKKKLLDQSWKLAKDALNDLMEARNALEYGRTYNWLHMAAGLGWTLDWDFQSRTKTIKEGLECGENAVKMLSTMGDVWELATTYVTVAGFLLLSKMSVPDPDEANEIDQRAVSHWTKACEFSEEAAHLELINFSGEGFGWGAGTDDAIASFKKALEHGQKARDKFLIGCALDFLAYHTFWKYVGGENPDERLQLAKAMLDDAEGASRNYSMVSFVSPRPSPLWVMAPDTEYYWLLALWEMDPEEKRRLLQRSMQGSSDLLARAEKSGCPEVVHDSHHVYSKLLWSMAKLESHGEERSKFLEEALEHRKKSIELDEQLQPFSYFNHGVGQNYLSEIISEQARLAHDTGAQKDLLREAIQSKEKCLLLCSKDLPFFERTNSIPQFAWLGEREYEHASLIDKLHNLTGNREDLKGAVEAFGRSLVHFQKANQMSRVAECYWKIARNYDLLGDHLKAAESFLNASESYKISADKIKQLKDFYGDHSSYMEAWNEIERARYHHRRQEYGNAREHYEKTSSLHNLTKRWNYLTLNYSAWAELENAEDLSRKEDSPESLRSFQEAAKLFRATKTRLQTETKRIEDTEERRLATKLADAAEVRLKYCEARTSLEEARILDREGDHFSSSEKYGVAAEILQTTVDALDTEQDRRELGLVRILAEAWKTMTRAEAEASPQLYREASRLFEEAKELNPNEKGKMLALGHSRFCIALEAATKYGDTRDPRLHAEATENLETATNYYLKAGYQKAEEYGKATELLLDAYGYMDNAKKEQDPEKKAKIFLMTEKVLQASASSYQTAQHTEKMDEVMRLLKKVQEDKQLALSLTEVLHAPPIVSTTASFASPTPTYEKAVGLERFERADIQANIIGTRDNLAVGENLHLEIQLVNVGRSPAQLMRLEELIPDGFELSGKYESYRQEGKHLNMRGRLLRPLQSEEVKVALRPKIQGRFTLKPRVTYMDEAGGSISRELQPLDLTVKELGISGWLKGPGRE